MSTLVEVRNLKKHYPVERGVFRRISKFVHAVDDVSFSISRGETVGLVGESGCGKTTVARLLVRLTEPTVGEIYYRGVNIFRFNKEEWMRYKRKVQIIFQNPYASLNPRKTLLSILSRPYKIHGVGSDREILFNVLSNLERVGLNPAEQFVERYPHQLSGGQRQRVVIARAISLDPEFLIADEPVSALDVSIRGQILNMIRELQEKIGFSCLLISHDLPIIRSLVSRIIVMYLGKIVELGGVDELFRNPVHPYTRALIQATPIPDPRRARAIEWSTLKGEPPSPINPPRGCRFHTRCPYAEDSCVSKEPDLKEYSTGHFIACMRAGVM